MTDPGPLAGGAALPPATFFDPTFERIPAAAAWDGSYAGPVLLLFDPRADRAWVADGAIALATAWTQAGRRAVLADLSLDDPLLHERIGMANLDGVVDIFLYGASLARSARPVPGRGFYLISGGTYTDDAGAILRHPRWEKIVAGFREAQASLLLFAPADADGLAELARWAGDAIVFGPPSAGSVFERALPEGIQVRAWLSPPGSERAPADAHPPVAPQDRFPEPEPGPPVWAAPAGSREVEVGPLRPAQPPQGEFPTFDELVGSSPAGVPVPDPAWEQATMPPRFGKGGRGKTAEGGAVKAKGKGSELRLLVLLVLLLLAAAAYFVHQYRPDLLRFGGGQPPAPAPAPAKAAAGPAAAPTERGVPLPYAVSTVNYDNEGAAGKAVRDMSARFPDVPFYVVPELNGGRLFYKVFAGMLADTAQAAAVRERLIAAGSADTAGVIGPSQLIQPRPWAYDLGTFDTDSAATVHADTLQQQNVPTYVVPIPFADGRERFRVYGGAFRDSLTAQPMRRMLDVAHAGGSLVRRTGRAPTAAPAAR
jgi:hypothetical protein